jgi:DNA polymerase III alpha subunit
MKEIWKDIKGYENLYQISTKGRIRKKGWYNKKRINKPILLHINIIKSGYCYAHLYKRNDKKSRKARQIHKLVAQAFIPNPLNKPEINHLDGNKQNNYIKNLTWVTKSENVRHSHRIGLLSSETFAKITRNTVDKIRNLYPLYNQYELAKKFDISQTQVNRILHYKCWGS